MNLNIIFTGQSNLSREFDDGTLQKVVAAAQTMLGFDGVTNTITLIGSDGTTAIAASNLLPASNEQKASWLNFANGVDATGGLTSGADETAMHNYLTSLPATVKASPTMVIFAHNESDTSTLTGLSVNNFEAAIRYQRADIDAALGQSANAVTFGMAFVPYDFLTSSGSSAYQQLGLVGNAQNAQVAEQDLANDPTFNGIIAAHLGDADMNGTDIGYGGQHTGSNDETNYLRFARAIAGNFASYALPETMVAQAEVNGGWDVAGPQVTNVSSIAGNTNQILLTVTLAQGSSELLQLGSIAASGAGFSVVDGSTVVSASSVSMVDATHLLVNFATPIHTDGSMALHIGYGVGRIAQPMGPGFGGAVYDNNDLPLWADPNGVAIMAAPSTSYVFGGIGSETVYCANGDDTVSAAQGNLSVFSPASGSLTFLGGSGSSTIMGGAGNTVVNGLSGTVSVYGSSGSLTAIGGAGGYNLLIAASGNASLVGGGFGDTIIGGSASNMIVADNGWENVFANGQSTVYGGADTTVVDGSGSTMMVAGSGSLAFYGGVGNATVFGGSGDNSFFGGHGSMTLSEGSGTSYVGIGAGSIDVYEGTGANLYGITKGSAGGAATISGFKSGSDKISLSGYANDEASIATGKGIVNGGNLTLTLSDNTRLTFIGLTSITPQYFSKL